MFSGIIEEVGRVLERAPSAEGARLRVGCAKVLDGIAAGQSIAVSGACLTATDSGDGWFTCDVSRETLERSTLGHVPRGARVNLERALRLDGRLDGHFVQGHVDGIGRVERIAKEGRSAMLTVSAPAALRRYIAEKGSIAVDGVSLTVAALAEESFSVAVIPTTWEWTVFPDYAEGTEVNLETDMLARYLERLLSACEEEKRGGLSLEHLAEEGFL